jgi:hypothetical protein
MFLTILKVALIVALIGSQLAIAGIVGAAIITGQCDGD